MNIYVPDSTIAAIYGGAVGGILVLVCLIGICLIALLLLKKKLSSEEQIAAPIYEEVGLSGNDIQLEYNDAYGKVTYTRALITMLTCMFSKHCMHAGC